MKEREREKKKERESEREQDEGCFTLMCGWVCVWMRV